MQLCLCRIISRTVNLREGSGTRCQQLQGPGWEGAGSRNPKTHPKASLVLQWHLRVPLHWCQGCRACVLCPLGSGTCAPTSLLLKRGAEYAPHFLVGTVKLAGKFLKTIGSQEKTRKCHLASMALVTKPVEERKKGDKGKEKLQQSWKSEKKDCAVSIGWPPPSSRSWGQGTGAGMGRMEV